jgi:hypothetical protein
LQVENKIEKSKVVFEFGAESFGTLAILSTYRKFMERKRLCYQGMGIKLGK